MRRPRPARRARRPVGRRTRRPIRRPVRRNSKALDQYVPKLAEFVRAAGESDSPDQAAMLIDQARTLSKALGAPGLYLRGADLRNWQDQPVRVHDFSFWSGHPRPLIEASPDDPDFYKKYSRLTQRENLTYETHGPVRISPRSRKKWDAEAIDLRNADLQGADFQGSDIASTDFRGANLRGANFDEVEFGSGGLSLFEGANLQGATFQGAIIRGGDIIRIAYALGVSTQWIPSLDFEYPYIRGPLHFPSVRKSEARQPRNFDDAANLLVCMSYIPDSTNPSWWKPLDMELADPREPYKIDEDWEWFYTLASAVEANGGEGTGRMWVYDHGARWQD